MAFQEIADHTKNVIDIVADSEHDKWHKVKEIGLEIAIIVFAVSLSIWFHSIGEHRHEQQQVRSFLLGLKRDLRADINQLYIIQNQDQTLEEKYRYLAQLPSTKQTDETIFDQAFAMIGKKTLFNPQNSRYEGFTSSGKLITIENNILLERVTKLYQSYLPQVKQAEIEWMQRQNRLQDFVENDFNGDGDFKHHIALITSRKGHHLSERAIDRAELLEQYRQYIELGTQIIKDIDQTYPGNEKSSFFSQEK
ncbi:DUF6090 family protein [Undibacterium cyanobacteriorum]|uniref:DUF6090 family protein n=1 Tax=Undibacterium cyanobacteriorum TaxID=3073561 RepID=A0ABY9RKF1_9BURK|nr:DUF6090 family protein [Undibacterium sp. 20NA77.5]WMW81150.1 DUF6090 family protein [Undibacterium sp. 20NA77.5]